jgi:hypothetical protein
MLQLARGPLDWKPQPRKISDLHDPWSSWSTSPHRPIHWQGIQCNHFRKCGYNATGVGTTLVSNPTFYCLSWYGGKKSTTIHATSSTVLPSTPPRLTKRQPPRPGFLGLSLIRSSLTLSTMLWPSLEHRRSIKEWRPHVDHRGSHARHRTQGLSPSHHQRRSDTPGMADHYKSTSLQQLLQYLTNLLLQDIDLGFFVPLSLYLSL